MGRLPTFLVPLADTLAPGSWPEDSLGPVDGGDGSFLDLIYRGDLEIEGDSNYMSIRVSVALLDQIVVPIPISEGTALVLGSSSETVEEPRVSWVTFVLGSPPAAPAGDGTGPSGDGLPETDEGPSDQRPPEPVPDTVADSEPLAWRLEAVLDFLSLRFGRDLLLPVDLDAATGEASPVDGYVELAFGCALAVNDKGHFDFSLVSNPSEAPGGGAVELRLNHPFQIGESKVTVSVGPVYLRFAPETPLPSFASSDVGPGVYLQEIAVRLPPDIGVGLIEGIFARNVAIGTGGFAGTLGLEWTQRLAQTDGESAQPPRFEAGAGVGDLFGMPFALRLLDFEVRQNSFARASLRCDVIPPVIEKPLGLLLSIDGEGAFTAEVRASDLLPEEADDSLIHLRQENLLDITVSAVRFELADDVGTFSIAGTVTPLVGGIDWPTLEVQKLSVNTKGEFDLDGGWVDVPESFSLDFHAFKIELDRVGFGTEGEASQERHWVGLSGGINLIEGIPLSASVEGLKVSWRPPRDTDPGPYDPDIRVALEGIAVHLEIPNTLVIDGAVTYREIDRPEDLERGVPEPNPPPMGPVFGHVFTGSIRLDITALNLEVSGELMIGELTQYHYEGTEDEGKRVVPGESFTALYIVMAVELPTALPLGATGAGLYGVKGLFGMHVAPARQLDPEGEPEAWYSWYKADRGNSGPYNVTKVAKWGPRFDNYAFGAGVTLGTVYDDGFTINAGLLAAILIPGPVVMIEGRANLIKPRGDSSKAVEGALYALMVFDGIAETFQLNVDINLAIEDVITVGGGLEAFFDFNDSSKWYIYIGRKDPLSKRIRAEVISIVTASAYFMIDPTAVRFGAAAGLDLQLQYGPLELKLIIRIAFAVDLFFKEPQLGGMIEIYVELTIRIFGIGISLILHALLEGQAPQPWWIHGLARAALQLPFPLPSFDVQVEFTWGQDAPPVPVDLVKSAAMVHPKLPGVAWMLEPASSSEDKWPVVPVDAVPVLSLAKPLSGISREKRGEGEQSRVFTTEAPEGLGVEWGYELRETRLEERNAAGNWVVITPSPVSNLRVRPDDYAREPQVELWWYSPLDTYDKYSRQNFQHPCPLSPAPEHHCVDWREVSPGTHYPPLFSRGVLSIAAPMGSSPEVKTVVPAGPGELDRGVEVRSVVVRFPEPVSWVEVKWTRQRLTFPSAHLRGHPSGQLPQPGAAARTHRPLGEGRLGVAIDTIQMLGAGLQEPGIPPVLLSICWVTQREFEANSRRREVGERGTMRGDLVLAPHRSYMLHVAAVRTETRAGGEVIEVEQVLAPFAFHTGGLPGTDYTRASGPGLEEPPPYADGPLNRVESYVKRTVPAKGAPLFYRGYDVLVEFSAPYAARMLAPVMSVLFKDQNGHFIGTPPQHRLLVGGLPFITSGLKAFLGARREESCADVPVPQTPQLFQKYIACALPAETRPGRLVRIELEADLPYGRESVYSFEASTSKFRDARAHMGSGLEDAATDARGVWRGRRTVRALGRRGGALPLTWIPRFSEHLAQLARTREALALAVVSEHDSGTTIEKASGDIARLRGELSSWMAAVYELVDRGGTLNAPWVPASAPPEKMTYPGVHALFEAAGLAHRPLPPDSVEALAIEAEGGFFILVESPEPLDWTRLTVRSEPGGEELPLLWSEDGTRLFVFSGSGNRLFSRGDHALHFSFNRGGPHAPDLDPLYQNGELSSTVEEVVWDLA